MQNRLFAIVTGSSSGIGLEALKSLLERDYFVFALSKEVTPIEDENLLEFNIDLSDESEIFEAFQEIAKHTDKIHLVIHSAGIFSYGEVGETTSDRFIKDFENNTLSTFHFYKFLEDFLIFRETHVINMSSLTTIKPLPYLSSYSSSEASRKHFLETIRAEWRDYKIRITNVLLGKVETPFFEEASDYINQNEMLSLDEVMYVLETIIDSPPTIVFNDISLAHIDDESFI